MNIKRFFGKNSREALSMVRKALGEDAVILSNRAMNGGNEIMAFKEEDMNRMVERQSDEIDISSNRMQSQVSPSQTPSNRAQSNQHSGFDNSEPTTLLSLLHNNRTQSNADSNRYESNRHESFNSEIEEYDEIVKRTESTRQLTSNKQDVQQKTSQDQSFQQPAVRQVAAKQSAPRQQTNDMQPSAQKSAIKQQAQQSNVQMTEMLSEMRNMRSVIESQLTAISWGNIQQRDPSKSQTLSALLSAGFSASLSRQLAENMPSNLSGDKAMAWIKAILAINLNTIENDAEALDQGGIFALIGPTGVGKTTTTAKLAARYVMKHGTKNLGLITTDAYRIGGHEQLRIYGKILGVMVHAVKDEADLKIALNELKNKHTILIDTVGVSQRDRMVAEQIAMLSNVNIPIKKLLCLNATSTGETLADVIRAYKGKGLDGCLITKLDEAATIGNALDVIIREKLKLYYVANGQRVPEDIHLANKQYLIQHSLKLSASNNQPFQFLNEELPFIMGNTVNAANASQLSGISYA
ncbi:MAG: flagellar biosynthesis protein FlhF [Methylotenera sp.]|nr:flagellar biosynthesis protein FlhF [Methylotenera sp.]